ncbi:hypothetical protein GO986_14830 [Deinococcus sp. HMF7620]|uniref:Uncharacterized protein n=1 Tax=Deinococcus arboris TaxID=2682977 RepID=A0A7C9HT12_9DEIO|nr:hypothetical protein [Deinococcus arboris]MVN88027.1 hypothetical protein [Deinococcus arboris]
MVQSTFAAVLDALHDLARLALPAGLLLGTLLIALLLLSLLDRSRARAALSWLAVQAPQIAAWSLVALALGAGLLAVTVTRRAVDTRLSAQQSARYANAADPDGGQTAQRAPSAALLETRTYTRSLALPRDVVTRIGVNDGWTQLLPYLGGAAGSVQDLQEGFTRQGETLTYSRAVTLLTERPVDLDRASIRANLAFTDPAGGRASFYNATFDATYAFTNPLDEAATMRFFFPLPQGSGTLSGFQFVVNGTPLRPGTALEGAAWEGEVPARGTVKVQVRYAHQGARAWSYVLSRREALRDLDLTLTTNRPAKFQRYALFPTSQTRTALGSQHTLRWRLTDVITAQDVAVVFTGGNLRETLHKVHLGQTAALGLAALLCVLWALTRRLPLRPLTLTMSLLGLALGFVLGGVLTAYLPPLLAEGAGSLTGLGLAWLLLSPAHRRHLRVPLVLCAALPLAFLSGGHAGLLVTALATLALLTLQWPARKVRAA